MIVLEKKQTLFNLLGTRAGGLIVWDKRLWDVYRVGVLLLDVFVKMEIIDFLLPRIKQKMLENIIITLDCVQP